MKEYAGNFNKGLSKQDINYYGKIEYNQYYTHEDPEVRQGLLQRGEAKEASHMHAQLIVSCKTADNGRLISPMTNHRRSNADHSQKFEQPDWMDFTERCEKAFDQTFSYKRELSEMFQYRKLMLNGTAMERADMIVVERSHQARQAKEQNQAIDQNKREKMELVQQPEIKPRQEQQKKRGFGFGM